jgi:polar amino acid transport system substrate-binding protein
MTLVRIWTIGLCLAWLSLPALAAPLRLVSNAWPPYASLDLPQNGLATDLVRTALARAGYASEYLEVPWARVLHGLQQGEYDIAITAWYSEERQVYGEFSDPYLTNRIRLIARKANPIDFHTLPDLYPYAIAVVRGYAYSPAFDADERLQKVGVTGFETALRMLWAGRVDVALEDEYVTRYLLDGEMRTYAADLVLLPQPLTENGLRLLVRRSLPEHAAIIAAFDQAIREMRADGSYAAVIARHGLP